MTSASWPRRRWGKRSSASTATRATARQGRQRVLALLIALAVVGCGAAAGAVVFRIDHARNAHWPTEVARTATGWRVSSPLRLSQSAPALAADRLAWFNGCCLELLDLRTGHVTVLVEPSGAGDLGEVAISDRFVVWRTLRQGPDGADVNRLVAYDTQSGQTREIGDGYSLLVFGSLVHWMQGSPSGDGQSATALRSRDLLNGQQRVIARGAIHHLADARYGRVAWVESGPLPGRSSIVVADWASGRTWRVTARQDDKHSVNGVRLTGDALLWETEHDRPNVDTTCTLRQLDLNTGRRSVVVRAKGLWGFTTDGDVLIRSSDDDGGLRLLARRLRGGPVVAIRVPGWSGELPVVDHGVMAWPRQTGGGPDGTGPSIEIAKVVLP